MHEETPQEGTFMSGTNKDVPTEALDPAECKGLADVLMSVGDKWTILVVGALSRGQLRYNEIQRRVAGSRSACSP